MKRYWQAFALVVGLSFAVLGWVGARIYQQAPPLPERVVTAEGSEIVGPGQISRGQNVWQAMGGMQQGSIWGHGSYVAPDWSADWLHREATALLELLARDETGVSFSALGEPDPIEERIAQHRGHDFDRGVDLLADVRIAAVERHDPALRLRHLRDDALAGVQRDGGQHGVHERAEPGAERTLGRPREVQDLDVRRAAGVERPVDGH